MRWVLLLSSHCRWEACRRPYSRYVVDTRLEPRVTLCSLLFTSTCVFSLTEGSCIAITCQQGIMTRLKGGIHGKYLLFAPTPIPTWGSTTKPTAAPYTCKACLTSFNPPDDPLGQGWNMGIISISYPGAEGCSRTCHRSHSEWVAGLGSHFSFWDPILGFLPLRGVQ